jgi:serine/threonine protein kinase/Flp pilus assembly protein TadD
VGSSGVCGLAAAGCCRCSASIYYAKAKILWLLGCGMLSFQDRLFGSLVTRRGWVDARILERLAESQTRPDSVSLARKALARGLLSAQHLAAAEADLARLRYGCGVCARAWALAELAVAAAPFCPECRGAVQLVDPQGSAVELVAAKRASERLGLSDDGDAVVGVAKTESGGSVRRRLGGSRSLIFESGGRRQLGKFELVDEVGRGASGVVYRVRDPKGGVDLALKVLIAGQMASERQIERFVREAAIIARLRHPGIVATHEHGSIEGHLFFTMGFVDGVSLKERLKLRRPKPRRAAGLIAKVARALHYAHGERVVHRDVKPANIMLDTRDQPVLTDFGLARELDEERRLTLSGAVIGTPHYMSPEQLSGARDLGPASDIYSLGVVLYELLCGRRPFDAPSQVLLSQKILGGRAPRPSRVEAAVDRRLDGIVAKAMALEPSRRYASALSFARALEDFAESEPVRPSLGAPSLLIGAVALALAFFVGVSSFYWGAPKAEAPREAASASGPRIPEEPPAVSLTELRGRLSDALRATEPAVFRAGLEGLLTELDARPDGDASSAMLRGVALSRLDRRDEARAVFIALGDRSRALYYLARLRESLTQREEFEAEIRRAVVAPGAALYSGLAKAFVAGGLEGDRAAGVAVLRGLEVDEQRDPGAGADVAILKSFFAVEERRFEDALRCLNEALGYEPNNMRALSNKGRVLLQLEEYPEILKVADHIDTLGDHVAFGHALRAEVHAARGDLQGALRALRVYLDVRPGDEPFQLSLARLLARTGRVEEAERIFRDVLRRHPAFAPCYHGLADLLSKAGRGAEFEVLLTDAIEAVAPSEQAALFERLARWLLSKKRLEDCERLCQRRLEQQAGDRLARRYLARSQARAGRFGAAIETLAPLVQPSVRPDLEAYRQAFELCIRAKRRERARELVRALSGASQESVEALCLASTFARVLADFGRAAETAQRARRLDPGSSEPLLALALASLDQGRFGEAERWARMVLELRSVGAGEASKAKLTIARARTGGGDFETGERLAAEALRLDPKNLPGVLWLLAEYLRRGRSEDARRVAKGAVEARLSGPGLDECLGRIAFGDQRYRDAVSYFDRSIRATGGSPSLHCLMAVAIARLGRVDQAIVVVRAGLKLEADHPELLKLLEELRAAKPPTLPKAP